jgi:hypothetical protein
MADDTGEEHYSDSESSLLKPRGDGNIGKNYYGKRKQRPSILKRLQPFFLLVNLLFSLGFLCGLLFIEQQLDRQSQYNRNGDVFGVTPKCKSNSKQCSPSVTKKIFVGMSINQSDSLKTKGDVQKHIGVHARRSRSVLQALDV